MLCSLSVLATLLSVSLSGAGVESCAQDVSVARQSTALDTTASDPATPQRVVTATSWFFDPLQVTSAPRTAQFAFAGWNDEHAVPLCSPQEPTSADDQQSEELPTDAVLADQWAPGEWSWQWLPAGLIYRSYMAGAHEPRMAFVAFYESGGRTLWDATLGGRIGLLRFGDNDPLRPQGYELDFCGAAIARLDVENRQDLDSTDYVFGFPLTYGANDWQFKLAYGHLSSHLGDELVIREPGILDQRINYVRDTLVLGASYYPHPVWRQYGEAGWAFHSDGGASPWEAQFGTELSLPGPTGNAGSPFLAVNAHLRQEHNFGGELSAQGGWLRRGDLGQTLRLGIHYFNGKSSQFQFIDNSEEQIGMGLWYDF